MKNVYALMQYIINYLKSKGPDFKVINIFSDGASSPNFQTKVPVIILGTRVWSQNDLEFIFNFSWEEREVDAIGGR